MIDAFSYWRFAHQRSSVWLPDTIHGAEPTTTSRSLLDPAFAEAAFEHLDATGMSEEATRYCGAAINTFTYGS